MRTNLTFATFTQQPHPHDRPGVPRPKEVGETPARADRDGPFKRELISLVPQLRAFARALASDPASADDLAQNTMLKAWRARGSFQAGTNMKAWTFRILRNQFYSEKRQSWRQSQLDQEAAERTLTAIDDPSAPLALDEVRMALAMLPDQQREALLLVGASGFSYEEAAAVCGCAMGTVKSRVSRGRQALADVLQRGDFVRDGRPASQAMGLILAQGVTAARVNGA
jgi:RNA polymerase sigma-70 factor (ECF subfamily)